MKDIWLIYIKCPEVERLQLGMKDEYGFVPVEGKYCSSNAVLIFLLLWNFVFLQLEI